MTPHPLIEADRLLMEAHVEKFCEVCKIDLQDSQVRLAVQVFALMVGECRSLVEVAVLRDAWQKAID